MEAEQKESVGAEESHSTSGEWQRSTGAAAPRTQEGSVTRAAIVLQRDEQKEADRDEQFILLRFPQTPRRAVVPTLLSAADRSRLLLRRGRTRTKLPAFAFFWRLLELSSSSLPCTTARDRLATEGASSSSSSASALDFLAAGFCNERGFSA